MKTTGAQEFGKRERFVEVNETPFLPFYPLDFQAETENGLCPNFICQSFRLRIPFEESCFENSPREPLVSIRREVLPSSRICIRLRRRRFE